MFKRYALVRGYNVTAEKVAAYLPRGYRVLAVAHQELFPGGQPEDVVVIEGRDNAGWTLDGYVIPRLGSGMMTAEEIDLSHPVMKEIPETAFSR